MRANYTCPHPVAADSGVILWVSLVFIFLLFFIPGKYHCPVLYSVFSNNSHIVANKVTGNVFSYEVREVKVGLLSFSWDRIGSVQSKHRHLNLWMLHQPVGFFLCFSNNQAVEQLNFKTKSLRDLLTDEPFTRKDIITIQVGCCCALHMLMF